MPPIRLLRLCLCVTLPIGVFAQSREKPVPSREYITAHLADLRKINTPEGIEALEAVGGNPSHEERGERLWRE